MIKFDNKAEPTLNAAPSDEPSEFFRPCGVVSFFIDEDGERWTCCPKCLEKFSVCECVKESSPYPFFYCVLCGGEWASEDEMLWTRNSK